MKNPEAEDLEEVRRTLLRRGWAAWHIKNLSPENLRAIAHEWAVDALVGISPGDLAHSLRRDSTEVLLYASRLLEEVDEFRLSQALFKVVENRGKKQREARR
jgi:hypothetical protein